MKSLSTGKGTKNSASQVQKANYICFLMRPCAIVGMQERDISLFYRIMNKGW